MRHPSHPHKLLRQTMVRLAALLLAFCLLPLAAPLARAETRPVTNLFGSTLSDLGDSIISLATVGDTLYIRTYRNLYAYTPGDSAPRQLLDEEQEAGMYNIMFASEESEEAIQPGFNHIFSDGERLYTLDANTFSLYTVTVKDGAAVLSDPVPMDLEEFITGDEPYRYLENPVWSKILDGRLYMKLYNYDEKPVDLYSFDIKTGEKKAHAATHLQAADVYRDGKLIAVFADPSDMYDMETQTMKKPQLVIFNPADDSVEPLDASQPTSDSYTMGPLYYDAAEDSLYTYTETDVYRLDGDMKTPRLVGYLPMFGQSWFLPSGLQPLSDGRLAIAFNQNIFLRERTEEGLKGVTVLTMTGGMDDPEIFARVLMEMDDIVLRRAEEGNAYLDAEQLATMFLTGNVTQDIMAISMYGFDMDKLIQKGYLADLSDNQAIKDYVDAMSSNINQPIMQDGKIYALPASIMLIPLSAYVQPFEDLGLSYPTTLMGLLDLAEQWLDGLAQEHPDYVLFQDGGNLKETLQRLVIDIYVTNTLGAGDELVFDTPMFRALMQRLDGLDFGDLGLSPDWETEEGRSAMEELWGKTPLFEANMGFEPRYAVARYHSAERAYQPLMLPLEEGQPAYSEGDIRMLVVMSTSQNQEVARRFLEHFLDKLDQVDKAAMNPEATAAIPNPLHDQELAQLEKSLRDMEAQLEKAEGVLRSDLEEGVRHTKEYLALVREEGKYLASEEDMARIHEVVGHLVIFDGLRNAQRKAFRSDYSLLQQYFDGAISLDQFIRQVDDKLRLVRMEYQ